MKKIVAALGALLFVGGVKAQPVPPVKKTTTPQVKSNTAVTTNNTAIKLVKTSTVSGTTIKSTSIKGVTVKGTTIKAADKNIKLVKAVKLALAPAIKE